MKIDVFNDKYLLRPDKVYFLRDSCSPTPSFHCHCPSQIFNDEWWRGRMDGSLQDCPF